MDYLETKTPTSPYKSNKIIALFQTKLSFEDALSALLALGYTPDEIKVETQAEVAEKRYVMEKPLSDPDTINVQLAVRGIIFGGTIGSLLIGLAILYMIQFHDFMLLAEPLPTILFGLFAGAIWGGTLGWLILPLLPYSYQSKFELTISKGQVLLSFLPKTLKDENFFKSLNWSMYNLAT